MPVDQSIIMAAEVLAKRSKSECNFMSVKEYWGAPNSATFSDFAHSLAIRGVQGVAAVAFLRIRATVSSPALASFCW